MFDSSESLGGGQGIRVRTTWLLDLGGGFVISIRRQTFGFRLSDVLGVLLDFRRLQYRVMAASHKETCPV